MGEKNTMRLGRILCWTLVWLSCVSTGSLAVRQTDVSEKDEYISVSTSPYVVTFTGAAQEKWEVWLWFSDFGKENENDVWKSGRQRWEFKLLSQGNEPAFIREIIVTYGGDKAVVKKYDWREVSLVFAEERSYEQKGVLSFKDKEAADSFVAARSVRLKLIDSKGVLREIEIPPDLLNEWQEAAKIIHRKKTNYNKIIEQFHA